MDEKMDKDEVSRRHALGVLLGAGSALAFGCGTSSTSASDANGDSASTGTDVGTDDASTGTDTATDATASTDGSTCVVTPEGEIGPYFADDSDVRFNRSNILTNIDGTSSQAGVALTLVVTVLDSKASCAPLANSQVDIWHCNSAGIYSDQSAENTSTETWLRGYQVTNAAGQVTFVTIIPGWYAGRTTHIHLRVRSSYSSASSTSDGTNTTQIFFAQTLVDMLATDVSPYSAEGKNPTTNASDHVYAGETNGANQLALSGSAAAGYTTAITIVLPITSEGTNTTGGMDGGMPMGGGPGGGP